jgi:hypothetical protein
VGVKGRREKKGKRKRKVDKKVSEPSKPGGV